MKNEINSLGEWCKWLEKNFSPEIMIPTLPVIIRLDGVNFSKWTKGLAYPYDENYQLLMNESTKFLVSETSAVIGYTQSDEITLILYSEDRRSAIYHAGKKQKILSKLSSQFSEFFNSKVEEFLPAHNKKAYFDMRIYQTPTLKDAAAQLLWRENDAIRNSILMLAYSEYSHKDCLGINTLKLKEKLKTEKNIIWENCPERFKRGYYVKKQKVIKSLNSSELASLSIPLAKELSQIDFERTEYKEIILPYLQDCTDLVKLIF